MRTWNQMLLATVGAVMLLPAAHAQNYPNTSGVSTQDAVDALILDELSQQQKERRAAERQPYAGHRAMGSISTAAQARKACASEALAEAGEGVKLAGKPVVHSMSTGWEVEGGLDAGTEGGPTSFVCSVRNGSVTGILLRR